jgi:hypothetical protein
MATVSIRSSAFPNRYLRLDGSTVKAPTDAGSGIVNCQDSVGPYEKLVVQLNLDGTISIGSTCFANVFLRADATGFTAAADNGGGKINLQYGIGPYEKWQFVPQPDGSVAIASVRWPNVYLRMDGGAPPNINSGSGLVNCQYSGAGPYEKFFLAWA